MHPTIKSLGLNGILELRENFNTLKIKKEHLQKKSICINNQLVILTRQMEAVSKIREVRNGIPICMTPSNWVLSANANVEQTPSAFVQITSLYNFTKNNTERYSCIYCTTNGTTTYYIVCEAYLNDSLMVEHLDAQRATRNLHWKNWFPLMEACKNFVSSDNVHIPTEEEIISLGGIKAW